MFKFTTFMIPSHYPIQIHQSLSCLHFHRSWKCINRNINIILYRPDSLISCNHLSHFSFVHNTLYILGARLIKITPICLVLCARNHISHFYRNIKHQPLKYRRSPQGYQGSQWPSQNSSPHLLNSKAFVTSRTLFCLWMEKNKIKQESEKVLAHWPVNPLKASAWSLNPRG